MAWRIGQQVTWGELDNRTIGRVTGILVLTGRVERLSLQGTERRWSSNGIVESASPSMA